MHTLSACEYTASSPELAAAFGKLKSRFGQIASQDERAAEFLELRLELGIYLASVPEPDRAANLLGSLAQQISYSARTLRDAAADQTLRTQLGSLCNGSIPASYLSACVALARLPPQDLDEVYRLATQIVEQAASDTVRDHET